jgi:hypothetical protein
VASLNVQVEHLNRNNHELQERFESVLVSEEETLNEAWQHEKSAELLHNQLVSLEAETARKD